eukprot:TRINITY_DN24899_c0_g5_i1.p1 TRINITY_DN24899_c0_g5~~TRINITY_DN24899_c0_g5_i1.p1  ORF type:complete len:951 (+),score=276.66 TRINITY_DN24899_c0_g5_i1:88-2940(+)
MPRKKSRRLQLEPGEGSDEPPPSKELPGGPILEAARRRKRTQKSLSDIDVSSILGPAAPPRVEVFFAGLGSENSVLQSSAQVTCPPADSEVVNSPNSNSGMDAASAADAAALLDCSPLRSNLSHSANTVDAAAATHAWKDKFHKMSMDYARRLRARDEMIEDLQDQVRELQVAESKKMTIEFVPHEDSQHYNARKNFELAQAEFEQRRSNMEAELAHYRERARQDKARQRALRRTADQASDLLYAVKGHAAHAGTLVRQQLTELHGWLQEAVHRLHGRAVELLAGVQPPLGRSFAARLAWVARELHGSVLGITPPASSEEGATAAPAYVLPPQGMLPDMDPAKGEEVHPWAQQGVVSVDLLAALLPRSADNVTAYNGLELKLAYTEIRCESLREALSACAAEATELAVDLGELLLHDYRPAEEQFTARSGTDSEGDQGVLVQEHEAALTRVRQIAREARKARKAVEKELAETRIAAKKMSRQFAEEAAKQTRKQQELAAELALTDEAYRFTLVRCQRATQLAHFLASAAPRPPTPPPVPRQPTVKTFAQSVEELWEESMRLELSEKERRQITDLLAERRLLQAEGTQATCARIRASLTLRRLTRALTGGDSPRGGAPGAPPGQCFCHKCGTGPQGGAKKCTSCATVLYYGVTSRVASPSKKNLDKWRDTMNKWCNRTAMVSKRKGQLLSAMRNIVEGARRRSSATAPAAGAARPASAEGSHDQDPRRPRIPTAVAAMFRPASAPPGPRPSEVIDPAVIAAHLPRVVPGPPGPSAEEVRRELVQQQEQRLKATTARSCGCPQCMAALGNAPGSPGHPRCAAAALREALMRTLWGQRPRSAQQPQQSRRRQGRLSPPHSAQGHSPGRSPQPGGSPKARRPQVSECDLDLVGQRLSAVPCRVLPGDGSRRSLTAHSGTIAARPRSALLPGRPRRLIINAEPMSVEGSLCNWAV